ncbi:reverse transcriptase domain-containing protein [Fusibacter sp. JL216-2]|uniref:reverse transcriptase domain-containing protein n=1 Tax=Fusibacter sp. JL216-2 TaxID=3071453 RepID=UPI003D32BBC0
MEKLIEYYIEKEAIKLRDRHQNYHNGVHLEYERNLKRIGNPDPKKIFTPECWNVDKKFNPFYVLKNKKAIAKAIAKRLADGSYKPNPPYVKEIPKKGGKGTRTIAVYQIPDAAVSNYLYNRLLGKNKHRFSSLAYAYRDDRNAHFAVQDISLELSKYSRVFISEFDFKDFFGSIDHKYLLEQLNENGFYVSEFEKELIKTFIEINDKGIPQGTSISLFLANIVCWELDKRLELEGLRFARYADDTIIWSTDYSKITKSFDIIAKFSNEARIDLNISKSDGISLLRKEGMPSEISQTKESFDFLGYKIYVDRVGIKDQSVKRIKQQISYLLYRNLIQPLDGNNRATIIVPNASNNDPSFVTAIMQIRRYLYGNLDDQKLARYIDGTYTRLAFKGIMSYYPLITDIEQMKELDSWLFNTIWNSIKLRERAFKDSKNINVSGFFPYNCSRDDFLRVCRNKRVNGKRYKIQIPSFKRIHLAMKKGLVDVGIERTMNPNASHYDY